MVVRKREKKSLLFILIFSFVLYMLLFSLWKKIVEFDEQQSVSQEDCAVLHEEGIIL
jgi:hypothetical protein